MTFGEPWHLYFLALMPLAILLYLLHFRWKAKAQAIFSLPPLSGPLPSASRSRQYLKGILPLWGIFLLVVASAQPRLGTEEKLASGPGADIMVVIDVSLSMAAQDVSPNRLERAKREALELIDKLENDRIGLVLFSQRGILRFPLTSDQEVARTLVKGTEVDRTSGSGTHLEEGIRAAMKSLKHSEAENKFVFLISDGEDQGSQFIQAASEAMEEGVPIYTVGIGRTRGSPIPIQDPKGQPHGLKLDSNGQVVMTRLEEGTLRDISKFSGGKYFSSGIGAMPQLYQEISLTKQGEKDQKSQGAEIFQVFALFALLALMVEPLISERRGTGK